MPIENLMQNVFDYFLSLYHQNSGTPTGDSILAFQPIGTHITPNMFKLNPTATTFSANLAVEQFSSLTNVVPAISADTFQRTFKTVEQSYDFLLEGSFPSPSGDNEDLTVFSNFKAQAKKSFDEMKTGSILEPLTQFHPAYATPTDWYDISSDANWTTYNTESSTSESQTHVFQADWRWQVLPADLAPILLHREVIDRISTVNVADLKDVVVNPDTSQIDMSKVILKPELERRLGDVLKVDLSSGIGQVLKAELPLSRLSIAPMAEATSLMGNVGQRIDISSRIPIVIRVDDPIKWRPKLDQVELVPISSPIIQAARLQELLKQSTQQTVSSTNLKMSFKYCLVQIDRPWISQAYLQTKHWYLPSHQSGAFSTGTFSNTGVVFPVIPIALILIKDLQITDWEESETDVVERSAGFGPFSFIGRTVDQNTKILTSEGAQVIGWVSQVMPLLPPDADPTP
ncbi:MAG: hypothetical protein V7K48_03295 [Nostoc sp.]|uniref:hypothetical protein n=1 Tax=Nostoc sp. TaxID=1180 RepID=UPI002FF68F97